MDRIIAFLRTQAISLQDTARRCTDPIIVSELQHIAAGLGQKANELDFELLARDVDRA